MGCIRVRICFLSSDFHKFESTIYIVLYLYSAQYLHELQDSKHYMTYPTAQVQPKSQVTDIPLTERQRLKDDNFSISLRFFSLPLGIALMTLWLKHEDQNNFRPCFCLCQIGHFLLNLENYTIFLSPFVHFVIVYVNIFS